MINKIYSYPVLFLLGILSLSCNITPQPSEDTSNLLIMSYNLRYDNPEDGKNRWEARKHRVANLIRFYEPAFIGTQEGLLHQLKYIDNELGRYRWIGLGREDGTMSGEFSAIFYDTAKVKLVKDSDETIWLSETPSKPSKSWDAALPRILTYGQFEDRSDNTEFYVFNTHFDHIGDTARVKSAELIVDKTKEVARDAPIIVTGDFNVTPDSKPYLILTSDRSLLSDAFDLSMQPHLGPLFTYEGFEVRSGRKQKRIDYILVNDKIQVLKHAIIPTFRSYRYPSDHLPVMAEINIIGE